MSLENTVQITERKSLIYQIILQAKGEKRGLTARDRAKAPVEKRKTGKVSDV